MTKTITYRCPCGQEWTRERARGVGSKSLACPAGCPATALEVRECEVCLAEWTRPPTKGQVPKACPDCQSSGNRLVAAVCQICRAPVRKRRGNVTRVGVTICKATDCRGTVNRGALLPSRREWELATRPRAQKVREVAVCLGCASPFIKRAHGQLFCAQRCRASAKGRSTNVLVRFVAGHCHGCGDYFVAEDWTGSGRWCSIRCSSKDSKAKRRIRKRGAYIEPASWKLVALRDGLACYLCLEDCDPSDYAYGVGRDGRRVFRAGMRFPTLEHVLAIDNGGEHSMTNGLLAHLLCNSQKGTKLLAS